MPDAAEPVHPAETHPDEPSTETVATTKKERLERIAPSPLMDGLRAELQRLVEGDLDANLLQIEQVAARGRELLMALKSPEARLLRGHPRNVPTPYSTGSYSTNWDGNIGGLQVATPYAPEQFGATSTRQLVNLIPDAIQTIVHGIVDGLTYNPERLVAAVVAARSQGHNELADKLEARLLGDKSIDKPSPPPASTAHTNGAPHPTATAPTSHSPPSAE